MAARVRLVKLTRLNLAFIGLVLLTGSAWAQNPTENQAGNQAENQDGDFFDSLNDYIPAEGPQAVPSQSDANAEEAVPLDPFDSALDELLSGEAEQVTVSDGLTVVLRGLDKVTGRTTEFDVPVEQPVIFGALTITARYCEKAPPEEQPEVTAFLQIDAKDNQGEIARAFSGWMYASSPALSALEHPVYDVWVMDCKTVAPSN